MFYVLNGEENTTLFFSENQLVTFLKENPDYIQRIPQYMIASYLKMTPETLSRIKKKIHNKADSEYKSIIETPKLKFLDLNQ